MNMKLVGRDLLLARSIHREELMQFNRMKIEHKSDDEADGDQEQAAPVVPDVSGAIASATTGDGMESGLPPASNKSKQLDRLDRLTETMIESIKQVRIPHSQSRADHRRSYRSRGRRQSSIEIIEPDLPEYCRRK